MENDILSLVLVNDNTKLLIKRIFRLALILLILDCIYAVFDFTDWYSFLKKESPIPKQSILYLFNHIIRPAIALVLIVISLAGHVLNFRAYHYMNGAIEQEDAVLLNKGFRIFYITCMLAIISFSIAIISILLRINI